jgi:RNase P/RNase MRP subunit p30
MKRSYADLHLRPDLREPERVSHVIEEAARLGYRLIAVSFPQNCAREQVQQLRDLCEEAKIDLASRVDLRPRTPDELIHSLRVLRRRFEIMAVVCESKSVARQAAKDRRVDLLNFPSHDWHNRFFDLAEAELASKALASFEVDIKPLLTSEGSARISLLSRLRREVTIAQKFHVVVVISSGASDATLMRKPREMAALASLFDLDEASAMEAVSKNPSAIVRRNREKLSQRFVAPGIRVIRRGKDCSRG